MKIGILKKLGSLLRRTQFHPQWLLGSNTESGKWVAGNARGLTLDVGCADRWIEPWLPDQCRYIGLDYYPTGKHLYGARPDVFADAGQLLFADESIDTVLMLEVMEHLRNPADALSEIARVLRPNGCMMLSMPFLYPIHDAPHDYQRLTPHGLIRDVEATGLRIASLVPVLGSIQTAGLLASLAMGGAVFLLVQQRSPLLILAPLPLMAVPVINVLAWLMELILPSWDAITVGYRLRASKP